MLTHIAGAILVMAPFSYEEQFAIMKGKIA